MGRRKETQADEGELRPVRLVLTPTDHNLLRRAAAAADQPMSQFAADAVLAAARQTTGEGDGKKTGKKT